MIERVIILAGVTALVLMAAWAIKALAARRVAAVQGPPLPARLSRRLAGGGIVYFFGPHCAGCRQQAQVLDRLSQDVGASVLRINAIEEPEVAQTLGILTVPTTVVVDEQGRVRALNPGFRPRHVLESQLRTRRTTAAEAP
jgi:thiol-disulfide isomerase/thioredoxin